MKKVLLSAIVAMIACVGINAQDTTDSMYIKDTNIDPGTEIAVPIYLSSNMENVCAGMCDIYLPEGYKIKSEGEGKEAYYFVEKAEGGRLTSRSVNFNVGYRANKKGEYRYRVIIYDTYNRAWDSDVTKPLFQIIVVADPAAKGSKAGRVERMNFAVNTKGNTQYDNLAKIPFVFTAGGADAINEVVAGDKTGKDGKMYTVDGVEVLNPAKGQIVIKNGKKIVVK